MFFQFLFMLRKWIRQYKTSPTMMYVSNYKKISVI